MLFAVPEFLPRGHASRPGRARCRTASWRSGLDLRGGSHLMLEAQTDDVRQGASIDGLEDSVRTELRDAKVALHRPVDRRRPAERHGHRCRPRWIKGGRGAAQAVEAARQPQRRARLSTWQCRRRQPHRHHPERRRRRQGGQRRDGRRRSRSSASRIDELGTREPTIVRQGDNRIVVQVPGLQDPSKLKALIGKTAKLEFKLVDVAGRSGRSRAGPCAGPGSQVLPYADHAGRRRRQAPRADHRRPIDQTHIAVQRSRTASPATSFAFDSVGSRKLCKGDAGQSSASRSPSCSTIR